jgi:hypothetical protein
MEDPAAPPAAPGVTMTMRLEHPISLFFHVCFRTLAIIAYILLAFFVNSFVIVFVVVILLLALDFWTVKNVTGRLLVGLRWWNEVSEDGDNQWVFESQEGERAISRIESIIFWAALFIPMVLWVLLAVTAIIKLNVQWLIVVVVALVLNGANCYGYVRCAKGTHTHSHTHTF